MNQLLKLLERKPHLYEQSQHNIWSQTHVAQEMLNAHLNQNFDGATRQISFVKQSVEWITKQFRVQKYPRLLDLGCGPGIYTELFYQHHYQVTGIDLSENSIQYAIKSAHQKNMNIEYIVGDYTLYDFRNCYDLMTMIYCDFGVLSTENRTLLLQKVYHMLSDHGILLFDVFTPNKYKDVKDDKKWEMQQNGFWDNQPYLDLNAFYCYEEESTYLDRHIIVTDDHIFEYNIWEHVFTLEELKQDLQDAGFYRIDFYGDVTGAPLKEESLTICVVAQK